MPSTTIALRSDVYKYMLDVKHDMEKRVGRSLSFSEVEKHLVDLWNNKIKRSDLNEKETL